MALNEKIGGAKTALPTRIAHYTILSGLKGIIDSGELWTFNVSFFNDRRELKHGLEASLQAVEKLAGASKTGLWHQALVKAAKTLSLCSIS